VFCFVTPAAKYWVSFILQRAAPGGALPCATDGQGSGPSASERGLPGPRRGKELLGMRGPGPKSWAEMPGLREQYSPGDPNWSRGRDPLKSQAWGGRKFCYVQFKPFPQLFLQRFEMPSAR